MLHLSRAALAIAACAALLARASASAAPPVILAEDASGFTLANGSVTARVDKATGSFSLAYDGLPVVTRGYWSQVGRSAAGDIGRFGTVRATAVRTDPAKNGGARAEVECRFGYDGRSSGLPCDVTMRFALGRGDHGLYTYAVWDHKPGYPAFSVGEARTAYKLNPDVFDFLVVDAKRRVPMPSGKDWDQGETLNMKEVRRIRTGPLAGRVEHKYDYSAILPDTPAYGWCGTKQRVGVWLINPSFEYVAGGPTKVELTGHNDVNPGGAPTLLNMWHGSHYGGSSLVVGEREAWTKVIGPFLVYCNGGGGPDALWHDALTKAATEQRAWPYGWVSDPNYPLAPGRGTVTGRLTISDPFAPGLGARNLRVGLASPPYTPDGARPGAPPVDWQRDSKHYQFWTRADGEGRFTIRNVRPGAYTLYAFADGVLGEYGKADVRVAPGRTLDLGRLIWTPVHYGRTVWQIGTADRSAAEFRHGDDYWRWGLYYLYPKEFPHDVDFIVGQSDPKRDWNYCQPPRIEGDRVEPTTWTIEFDLPDPPPKSDRATLRLALCGSRGQRGLAVTVNDTPAGDTGPLPDTGVMHRDGIRGYWYERDVAFDAALLHAGRNTVKLHVPATNWTQGVLYDCIRLEMGPAK